MPSCVGAAVVALTLLLAVASARSVPDLPEQIHINQGDFSGRAMVVSWITQSVKESTVVYDTDPSFPNPRNATGPSGKSYSYTNAYTGTYTSGLIHHVNITGLSYDTVYYYKCGSLSSGVLSPAFQFSTPPPVGPQSSYTLAVIGDLGQTSNSQQTMEHVLSDPTMRMVLLSGDLSYADSEQNPRPGNPCTQTRWDSWARMVQPLFSQIPLMPLPGNHEVEQEGPPPATQQQFVAFQARFSLPSLASGAQDGNLYYSFEVGPAHFILLSSYQPFDVGTPQYNWLLHDLQSVDRSRTPWLIASMHAPWYNSNTAHHDEQVETGMRSAMEKLFYTYKVDLVFAGHVHAYERSHPVYNQKPTSDAPTYITIGDGGNREGHASEWYPQPDWSAFRAIDYGHGRLDILNGTYAHWTWHSNVYDEEKVSDEIVLLHNDGHAGVSAIAEKHWPAGVRDLVRNHQRHAATRHTRPHARPHPRA